MIKQSIIDYIKKYKIEDFSTLKKHQNKYAKSIKFNLLDLENAREDLLNLFIELKDDFLAYEKNQNTYNFQEQYILFICVAVMLTLFSFFSNFINNIYSIFCFSLLVWAFGYYIVEKDKSYKTISKNELHNKIDLVAYKINNNLLD
ncbi:hypothetical protein [Campylobacter sp. RM12651]|uniref:hypothetical protein n=1 Tax=Campylobacter sp. RM12651 TaxID=1660079 RepID=UPI001EFBB45A|nr:hypothetical protein [Campylobacter sp. RM12651]ULO03821.1 putative membrane protein [Campylobacter sp. RM12651]